MSTQTASAGSRNGHDAAGLEGFPRDEPRADESGSQPASGLGQRLARAVTGRVRRRAAAAGFDERDPDYIRESLPALWLLVSLWFRGEVRGLGNIPEDGPVLLVGNHSGGTMTPDTAVFTLAFSTYFGVERRLYQLANNLVLSMPGLGFLRKYGMVASSPEHAARALSTGAALLVYPGGDVEVHRPSWERHRVDFAGRTGFVALALEQDVPIVGVVAIGGQETALFLGRGESLSRLLMLDRLFGRTALPLSLAFPWFLNVGDVLGHVPLPAKITIEVLPALNLREQFGAEPDLHEVYDHVTRTMQETLDALAAERRLPIIG
jgi:1-acyl-sn-glycerol-3-phosphate acyltransferase